MGLFEALVEISTPLTVVVTVLLILGTYTAYNHIQTSSRRAQLGARAPEVPYYLPLGLDFIWKVVTAFLRHRELELWEWMVDATDQSWTVEANLGGRVIFTADPENIKAVLATQFSDYGKGELLHEDFKEFLGDGIFAVDGDIWHTSRQLIRPQFIKDRISDLQCFETHVQTLFKCIANGGPLIGEDQVVDIADGQGQPLEFSDLILRFTLDVATDFLFGKDVKSLTTPHNAFSDAFTDVQRWQTIFSRFGGLRKIVPHASFRRGLVVINEFVNQYIDDALRLSPEELASREKTDTGYNFLHALASFTRDRTVLRDQVVAVLLAGRDTTASALSWMFYELARSPQVVARLRAEILETLGPERKPSYADLKGMKYLQAVLSETLRLYPSIPFNLRTALRDTTLPRGGGPGGDRPMAVLEGTRVTWSTLAMQRRPDLYPADAEDPGVFCPERWARWQPRPWQYIPFNGGPRICVGQQFVLAEMAYLLARVFQRFERVESFMEEIDGGRPKLNTGIVMTPGDGVRIAFWEPEKAEQRPSAG